MLMLILWTIAIAAFIYYFTIKPYDYWKNRGVKQGKPYWLIGDQWGPLFGKQSLPGMVQYVYNQCPGTRYSGIYELLNPTLLVKDPDLLKQVTVKDFDHFADHRNFLDERADPLWSKNLFALTGQQWRDMRATLSPSFTATKMRAMFVLIQERAENFVQYLLEKNEEVISLEMKETFTRFTNDVIATTAFGIKVDSLREPDNEFYLMGKTITNFSGFWTQVKIFGYYLFPKLFGLLNLGIFSREIGDFFMNLVNGTIKVREEQGIIRPDMIHLLMEARKGTLKHEEDTVDHGFATVQESQTVKGKASRNITNVDIASQVLLFFFAGFETVATAICFTCHELAVNPDIQERLRKEVAATSEECGGKLTYEALFKMKYMDMVVSEGLRKWPSAPVVDRLCIKPYTIEPTVPGERPVHLKSGAALWIPIFALHRDPDYFPDPDRFDPERFNGENKGQIKPYTYFPFGLGPRNCIGSRFALMELKSVLFYVLLNFELVPVEKTPNPLTISKESFNTATAGGFYVGLKRIKK